MEKRNLFSKIFGNKQNNDPSTLNDRVSDFTILNGNKAVFTNYNGRLEEDSDVIACIDAIARNAAKMHPRHIRNFSGKMENVKDDLYKLLAKQPNEIQNAFKFYYQIVTELEMNNNALVYIQRDSNLKVEALYPLNYQVIKFYEYKDKIWVKFKFGQGIDRYVPYSDCIHLTKGTSEDGLFGGSTKPLIKALSIKHIVDEGIVNAIKLTTSIRGVVKTTKSLLKSEDIKKMRDQFVQDFMDESNKKGIGGLDATTEFTPIKIEPTTANGDQLKRIDSKILSFFGINESIIQSKYSEDEWNAFYESVLEPIGLQMSLEFSNKIFTPTEKAFGNEIIFESNRLQYASNETKIKMLRYANNIMTMNELREIFNLAPREDGDVILIDQNHNVMDVNEEEGETNEGN